MSLEPMFPVWAITLGLLALALLLGILEWRRGPQWRWARLLALSLVLLAIAGVLLRPQWETMRSEDRIILLTNRYDRRIVDSLRTAHPQWEIWRTAEAAPYPRNQVLDDWLDLTELGPRIGAIVGEGLPGFAFEYFPDAAFVFFPAEPAPGVVAIVDKTYHQGQVNQVKGSYLHRGEPVRLLLHGPALPEDSVWMDEAGTQAFSLGFLTKESGRWTYRLQLKDSLGRLLEEQLLPVKVQPSEQLRVLILQAFPTFELRYLKDFLADRGHAVAVRAQISRDRYRTEFANLPARRLDRLNADLLADFDLILLNGSTYDQLDYNERSLIDRAIDDGLGFLGLIDGPYTAFRRRLGLYRIAADPDTIRFNSNTTVSAYAPTPDPDREWYPVQNTASGRFLTAYHYDGLGKVGFQSIQESYASLLRGDSLTYAALWMSVLEEVQRTGRPQFTIELEEELPIFAGNPVDFRVVAAAPLAEVYADTLPVPMREDYAVDNVWYGRTWPRDTGWHHLQAGEQQLDYYVYPAGAWSSLAAKEKYRQTALRTQSGAPQEGEVLEIVAKEPVSPRWFYLLFLLGAGFLWLAPKL